MADYEILKSIDTGIPTREIGARVVMVLINAVDRPDATNQLRSIARELLTSDALTLYAYIEREAVKWQGWIARVEYRAGGVPRIFFDNDPILREAIYRDLQENTSA